jgi:AraC-like DNA-binding protein
MPQVQVETGSAISWQVPEIEGVECFRASAIWHHYGRHSHAEYAIGVIEGGVGGNYCRGVDYQSPPGQIVVMNPEDAHTGYSANNQPLTYRMLYISRETFQQITATAPYFHQACVDDPYHSQQIRKLHQTLETSANRLAQQTLLVATLSAFAQAHGAIAPLEAARVEPQVIRQVEDYLRANYHRNVSIEELIQLTGWSRAYLIRTFHKTVGLPPHTYLLKVRIEAAKRLLSQGVSIATAAHETGFADQSHLTRHFKSMLGVTPSQYAQGHFHSRQALSH